MELRKLTFILAIGLFLSLSANMFLAGMVMGRAAGGPGNISGELAQKDLIEKDKALRENLSAKDREAVQAAMEGMRPRLQALRQELRAAQDEVQQAMNAEPFDQSALDAALYAEKEKKMKMLGEIRQVKQIAMQNLSPEGQQALQRFGKGGAGRFKERLQQRQDNGFSGREQRPFLRNREQREPSDQAPSP